MSYQSRYLEEEPSRADIDARPGWALLEFGAPWCPQCIGAQPLVQALLEGREDVDHLKVEDGRGRPLGRSFAVKLWPTLVLLRDGQVVAQAVRPRSDGDLGAMRRALEQPHR